MNIFRRLALPRLLALCGLVLAIAAGVSALAVGLSSGPTPPPKPLADAVHDALSAERPQGLSARIQLTNRLVEGADLQGQGGEGSLSSSPLLNGASGRLWISAEGRARLELQAEGGDTQIYYDPNGTVSLYDAAHNTLDRYTLPEDQRAGESGEGDHQPPTVPRIQQAIDRLMGHAQISGAMPGDIAGQPTYTVRMSPLHHGGLIAGAELAWDATHGVPLRVALYSTTSASPVIELVASDVSYGPVDSSVFTLTPPPGVKINDLSSPRQHSTAQHPSQPVTGVDAVRAAIPFTLDAPPVLAGRSLSEARLVHSQHQPAALLLYGEGLDGIAVLESQANAHGDSSSPLGALPKVHVEGASANALPTPLGTIIEMHTDSVRYLIAGSVTESVALQAARGL